MTACNGVSTVSQLSIRAVEAAMVCNSKSSTDSEVKTHWRVQGLPAGAADLGGPIPLAKE